MDWCRRTAHGWQIAVHAQPGAKKSGIAGLHGDRLKVRIAAPAIEGRANEALVDYLAGLLGVPRSKVRVAKGELSREKLVMVEDERADVPALATR
jgi:hypothetical protein